MPLARSFYASCALCLLACSGKPAEPAAPTALAAAAPAAPAAPAANTPTAVPAAPTAPAAPAGSPDEEACARAIVVAFKGADPPTEGVTRDKAAAEARARELLAKVQAGADIGALAHSDSDAPASAARDGYFATFKRGEWPPMHAAIRDAVYTLKVGETAANVVAAQYGYAVLQRCAVEKAHSRHILIRYKGAKRADSSIKRSKAEAEAKAKEILKQLAAGADFATIAGNVSEDSSRDRGGDIGPQPRGNLAPAFEKALFALKPGERSGVVETEMGFHIIERVPD